MKVLTNMKKVCNISCFSLLFVAICLAIGVSSCGSDDSEVPVFSVNDVNGNYTGKMLTLTQQPQFQSTETPPQGVDITTEVKDNNIIFNKLPVDDLIKSIVGEENAASIIEALGDIKYQVAFQASFKDKSNDAIYLQLDPKPLELELTAPSQKEGEEPAKSKIKVIISVDHTGVFTYADHKLNFTLHVEKVMLDENEFSVFQPTSFKFDLSKK